MNVQPAVWKETGRIALGTAILSAVMVAVFALIGQLDSTVIWGTLLGGITAVGNFFLLGLSVQRAAARMNGVTLPPEDDAADDGEKAADGEKPDKPLSTPEIQQAKRGMQLSYTGRMLLLVAVGILALSAPCFHPVPTAIALLFPRFIIFIQGFAQSKQKGA